MEEVNREYCEIVGNDLLRIYSNSAAIFYKKYTFL
jgi:hypothetical protein